MDSPANVDSATVCRLPRWSMVTAAPDELAIVPKGRTTYACIPSRVAHRAVAQRLRRGRLRSGSLRGRRGCGTGGAATSCASLATGDGDARLGGAGGGV